MGQTKPKMTTPTVAIILAIFATVAADPCGDDAEWRYFPTTNSCYKLIAENLPWTIAEFKCLFQGAHHVAIASREENQFVHELTKYQEIWTGAAFFGKDMRYVNSDGSQYGKFENWQGNGNPPLNKARRCIKMDNNGEWFQSCCKKKTFTVCEKKATTPAPPSSTSFEESNRVNRWKFFKA